MLITSGSRVAALEMVEQSCIASVMPMEKEHALALLKKKLGDFHNQEGAVRLASELESMPLARVQVAAYIR
jgi:hypothetical protein